jgi:uncharacterized protein (DUF2062 family)
VKHIFKQRTRSKSIDSFIKKYKIPREFLSVNRKSISLGLYVGIFIAFIPMPFQMLAVLALTPFLRFNIPIAIAMVWLSNPLTMPGMYYMEYMTGNFLLSTDGISDIELTLDWFENNIDDIILPLYLGTLFYSVIVSTTVYYFINYSWINEVLREKKQKAKNIKWIKSLLEDKKFRTWIVSIREKRKLHRKETNTKWIKLVLQKRKFKKWIKAVKKKRQLKKIDQ